MINITVSYELAEFPNSGALTTVSMYSSSSREIFRNTSLYTA